jgi:tetratricopeptide (TPR) repeat protein
MNLRITPLQLRLLVGLVALGDSANDALLDITVGNGNAVSLERLLKRLDWRLGQPENQSLMRGVLRFAQARYPLPTEVAVSLAELPPQNAPLLTDCLAYGGTSLRMAESVRRHLLGVFPAAMGEATVHDRLAKHYQALDGVTDPLQVQTGQMLPWLEKVHHLAHSGPAGAAAWKAQRLPARDFYWDRARALSIEQRDHAGAAALYKQCIEAFGEDDYSCHYYAYNLDRAGSRPEEVEWGYGKAVELAPDNAWWNSRLVTFMVSQARFQDAEQAWSAALERLDPDRVRIHEDERLARSFHRWVVRAWLENGEVARARAAFDEIPAEVAANDVELRNLAWRLEDAEEAVALGESVYPAGVPVSERWRRPSAVAERAPDGSGLQSWFPGRILEAEEDQLTVVLAVPEPEPMKRRVIRTVMTAEEWQRFGGWGQLPEVSGFFIFARYESGVARLIHQQVPQPPWEEPTREESLRYLRQWART